jgi:hypothetical protein
VGKGEISRNVTVSKLGVRKVLQRSFSGQAGSIGKSVSWVIRGGTRKQGLGGREGQ